MPFYILSLMFFAFYAGALLGFSPSLHPTGASLEEIRSKYKKQALRWHPDKHGNSRQATMVFSECRYEREWAGRAPVLFCDGLCNCISWPGVIIGVEMICGVTPVILCDPVTLHDPCHPV